MHTGIPAFLATLHCSTLFQPESQFQAQTQTGSTHHFLAKATIRWEMGKDYKLLHFLLFIFNNTQRLLEAITTNL